MSVENVEQQVMPEATQASAPEAIHPIAAAFGGDIGEALKAGGEQISARIEYLSMHLARMNYYRGMTQTADIVNKYKQGLNTQLKGDPTDPSATTTYTPSAEANAGWGDKLSFQEGKEPSNTSPLNQPQERPLGVYNWSGNMAHGALDYINQWHQQAANQAIQQAQGLGLRNLSHLKVQLDNAWASEQPSIANHETTEIDNAQQKTFLTGMDLDAKNAVTKQDPVSLGATIDSINYQNKLLNDSQHKEADDPIRQVTSDKFVTQALNNSMVANLRINGGDTTKFQGVLDKLHDDGKINDTVYQDAVDKMGQVSKTITSQNEEQEKIQQVNTRMNYIGLALKNKLSDLNPNAMAEIGKKDPQVMSAIEHHRNNPHGDVKLEDEDFEQSTKDMADAGSKEQISNYMMKALKEKSISQDRLNILFDYATDKGKSIADLAGQPPKTNPMQNMMDNGLKAIADWSKKTGLASAQTYADFMIGVKSKPVPEAYNDAITNSIVKNHPAVASMSTPPNMVITKNSDIKAVFPRTHRTDNGTGDTDKSGE